MVNYLVAEVGKLLRCRGLIQRHLLVILLLDNLLQEEVRGSRLVDGGLLLLHIVDVAVEGLGRLHEERVRRLLPSVPLIIQLLIVYALVQHDFGLAAVLLLSLQHMEVLQNGLVILLLIHLLLLLLIQRGKQSLHGTRIILLLSRLRDVLSGHISLLCLIIVVLVRLVEHHGLNVAGVSERRPAVLNVGRQRDDGVTDQKSVAVLGEPLPVEVDERSQERDVDGEVKEFGHDLVPDVNVI